MKSIAIIGAGTTGLLVANYLHSVARVTVFEKSDRVGGRASSRKQGIKNFDHGAQFFTTENIEFKRLLLQMSRQGVVSRWHGRLVSIDANNLTIKNLADKDRLVGTPSMQSICEFLSKGLDLQLHTQVDSLSRRNGKWCLGTTSNKKKFEFDWLIFAIPPMQVNDILPRDIGWSGVLNNLRMRPCISLMGSIKDMERPSWDGAIVSNSILGWIGFNNTKPKRPLPISLIAQSSYDWAEKNLDSRDSDIKIRVLKEIKRILFLKTLNLDFCELKKWTYAVVERPLGKPFLFDDKYCVASAGDWCIGKKINSSFESATKLSEKLYRRVT